MDSLYKNQNLGDGFMVNFMGCCPAGDPTGIASCHQQKKDTEVESHEAESQWRSLFRKLRGEMTPELQAQHHSRISKRD